MDNSLRQKIFQENRRVHLFEAGFYDQLHPEIYNSGEQKRVTDFLRAVSRLNKGGSQIALDFGAGTGNITGKLLDLGYHVIALDISPDMCEVLKSRFSKELAEGRLQVITSAVELAHFSHQFDLICCYSVLHHLPNYLETIGNLSIYLKTGGIIYLDHEVSPYYWLSEKTDLARRIKSVYFWSSRVLNAPFWFGRRRYLQNVKSLDYTLSDYWTLADHHLDHQEIETFFSKQNYGSCTRLDYHLHVSWIFNPFYYVYRKKCNPDMSCWISRK
jgi:SAM-dependent methyltransferase